MTEKEKFLSVLPKELQSCFFHPSIHLKELQEIRLRIQKPVLVKCRGQEHFLAEEGGFTRLEEKAYRLTKKVMREVVEFVSSYSLYAFEEELRQGYLTIQGGHRIGLSGRVVLEQNRIAAMKNITCMNIRIAHEIKGCAENILPWVYEKEDVLPNNVLLVSPPCGGKTTLLRDLVRIVSTGSKGHAGLTVGLVDERSELAASYLGVPQNDVGIRTDVLDGCPKAEGMQLLVRTMSPQVLAVDEVGTKQEWEAMRYALYSGCIVFATVHGDSYEQLRKKPGLRQLMEEGYFQRIILLEGYQGRGKLKTVYGQDGKLLYQEKEV